MSGSTKREWVGDSFALTLETACISFAVDPDTGRSPEQEFHREAARRIERALAAVRDPLAREIPGIVAGVRGTPPLVRYDAKLPAVFDFNRKEFLASGNRACLIRFPIPAPECATLGLCFAALPDPAAIEDLKQALRTFFEKVEWPA
ncbi:MAG: hypothetical protein HYY17_06220 [Planctomycetes bacterium]|nr:hypothetical protein [Planctomycetota bacterium]